jgi:predicted DNA-binding mobile mystery protein A
MKPRKPKKPARRAAPKRARARAKPKPPPKRPPLTSPPKLRIVASTPLPAEAVAAPPVAPIVVPPVEPDARPRGRGRQREAITTETRAFPRMKAAAKPRAGWIRAIRDALGLSQSQIARRVGVSRATVQQWERAEQRRRITVHSLDLVAHAMDCTVALAIVPKNGTLDDVRRRQARARAIGIVKKEDAPADPDSVTDLSPAQQRRVDRIVARLLRGSPRRLWKQ